MKVIYDSQKPQGVGQLMRVGNWDGVGGIMSTFTSIPTGVLLVGGLVGGIFLLKWLARK